MDLALCRNGLFDGVSRWDGIDFVVEVDSPGYYRMVEYLGLVCTLLVELVWWCAWAGYKSYMLRDLGLADKSVLVAGRMETLNHRPLQEYDL